MRDPELMLSLLKEMADDSYGRIMMPAHIGMSPEEQKRRHHVELLIDANHAEWASEQESIARITNTGYDFLNAIEQGETAKQRFVRLFNSGMRYVSAANEVMDLLSDRETGAV